MSNDQDSSMHLLAMVGLFGLIAILIAVDMWVDRAEGAGWRHLSIEAAVLLGALVGIVLIWRQLQRSKTDLAGARRAVRHWQQENQALLAGLGAVIAAQFARWQLSRAESEVALLLLKGFSHQDIADLRRTSERTVREQARAVYRKSDLSGRSALSAFFLEDLLLPAVAPETDSPGGDDHPGEE